MLSRQTIGTPADLLPLEVLKSYPAHAQTVHGLLESRAARDGERPFLIFEERRLSYAQVRERVARAAALFAARGVARGDRVAVMAANSDHYVIAYLALARLGAILVPVNPDFGVDEARYVAEHAEVCGLLCSDAALPVAQAACARRAPWSMTIEGEFAQALAAQVGSVPPPCAAPDDTCLILYTSGTTGFPKGVMHSQRNFVLAGEAFVERMHLQPHDRLLMVLPLFHINALFYSLGGALAAGAALVVAPRFSASAFWPLAARTQATEVNIIAAVGNILARRPREEFEPGHRIAKVYGAPITPEMAATFREDFGIATLIEGYGMTEIPGACNNPFDGPHKPGSMGRPARHPDHSLAFAQMRVLDEQGRDLPDGATGELAVRTPILMQGYFRDPLQSAAAMREGWFLTGDLVRRDADGYFFFVARSKDIIRKRGENISGAELDRVVGAHPQVVEAAAIAVPAELGEDDILIAVQAEPGARLAAEDIGAWCARHLAPVKRPRYVVFVDDFPRTPTHRIAKFRLRQDAGLRARAVDLEAGAGS